MHAHCLTVGVWNLTCGVKMPKQKGFPQKLWPTLRDLLTVMCFHHKYDIAVLTERCVELPGRMVVQGNLPRAGCCRGVGINPVPHQGMKPGR